MARMLLNARAVQSARCPDGKIKCDVFDIGCKGLMLEVRATGGKTYYLRYSDKRGRIRQLRLADSQDISLVQARRLADAKRAEIAMGKDPAEEKQIQRSIPTLRQFMQERYLPHIKSYKRAWLADDSYLRNHILPALGSKYLDELTYRDILLFQQGMRKKGYALGTCNRCVVLLRYGMNLAIKWREPGLTENPTKDVQLYELSHRERFLTPEETKRLFDAVKASENRTLQYIVPMLMLTGARKREVLDAQWDELDMTRMQWRIPITKSGKPRHVPISLGVVKLLNTVPRYPRCPYVFPNPKSLKPFVSIFNSWNSARIAAGLEEVRIHDLRHSFASFLVNAGRSLYEVQKILGHTRIDTTQRYAHLSQSTLLAAANAAVDEIGDLF
jgi:integrase